MELIVVGPLEPAQVEEHHRDVWCEGQRVRYDAKLCELVWTEGTCNVRKRLALPHPSISKTWPIFARFEQELCLCAFIDPTRILVSSMRGAEWEISLPFAARRMWPSASGAGILVERSFHPSLVGEPFLFSVRHPLEEAKPVSFFQGAAIRKAQQVVWVSQTKNVSLVLTLAVNERVHLLWALGPNTMMMEQEEEDKIHSEVMLTMVRRIEGWADAGLERCFVCNGLEPGSLVLCALLKRAQSLVALRLPTSTAATAAAAEEADMFTIAEDGVLDAGVAFHATEQGIADLLVLRANNSLQLYRAQHALCEVVFSSPQRIVKRLECQDEMGGAFDLVFQDETRSRVVLASATPPPLHAGQAACAHVLEAAREADCEFGLRLLVSATVCGKEWDALVGILQSLLAPTAAVQELLAQTTEMPFFDQLLSSHVHWEHVNDGLFPGDVLPARADVNTALNPISNRQLFFPTHPPVHIWLQFFHCLHLKYQDLKLNVLRQALLVPLAALLAGLAQVLLNAEHALAYQDAYRRDLGENASSIVFPPLLTSSSLALVFPPPDVMQALQSALLSPTLPPPQFEWKGTAARYHAVFCKLGGRGSDLEATEEMVRQGITLQDVDTLPFGVQTILRELLHRARESPPRALTREAAILIGREDWFQSNTAAEQQEQVQEEAGEEEQNEFASLLAATKFRFAVDHRIKDVFSMLNASKQPIVYCERKPGMSDHDLIKVQQGKLRCLLSISLASSVGRGALLLFSKQTGARQADKPIASTIPALAKTGLVPPQNVSLSLEEHNQFPYAWPSFHNGVAAALARTSYHSSHKTAATSSSAATTLAHRDLTRSWILFNKPGRQAKQSSTGKREDQHVLDTHAGVLLAWGLNKDLALLTLADTYEHLETPHELTSIAVLIGLGAAKAGTCDVNARKTLTLHVPALFPVEFSEIDVVPVTVQCAALCGLGLLYRGTCNRLMCEFLLEEMSHTLPSNDGSVDFQCAYSLSAGLALGHVALGLGAVPGGLAGLGDLEVEDRLHLLMNGGPVSACDSHQALLGKNHAPAFDVNDLFAHAATGAAVGGDSGGKQGGVPSSRGGSSSNGMDPKCSRVLEGNHINTDVTAPGATLALGLIYLKSHDAAVANRLAAPQTKFLLENIRPDHLLYRVWARALVMWDQVEPSSEWIEAQVPAVVSLSQEEDAEDADEQDIKYFGQVRTHILAGACLGMGFRFVGSASQRARDCLLGEFDRALRRGNALLLSCICTALSLVMAGTGDLDTLKAIRTLRRSTAHYGLSQLASQSLGFLFLGAGKRSFASGNEAIAALVHAVFPRACAAVEDNSHYLQAMRHLYVLASESRVVETFDLDTGRECFTPLVVTLSQDAVADFVGLCPQQTRFGDLIPHASNNGEKSEAVRLGLNEIYIVAPALLPPRSMVSSIRVASPRYWPLHVARFAQRLVVQLRADQLSYEQDAHGFSCLQARPRPRAAADLLGSLRDFSAKSPTVLALLRHAPASFDVLYAGMILDALNALPCMMEVHALKHRRRTAAGLSALDAEQLAILTRYYHSRSESAAAGGDRRLVSEKMLVFNLDLDKSALAEYLHTGRIATSACYAALNFHAIPRYGQMDFKQVSRWTNAGEEAATAMVEMLDSLCS